MNNENEKIMAASQCAQLLVADLLDANKSSTVIMDIVLSGLIKDAMQIQQTLARIELADQD